jgi:hypothetical protein
LIYSADCFPSTSASYPFQQFVYNQGSTKIRVAPNTSTKTDYCVDFGSDRGVNGVGLKVGLRFRAACFSANQLSQVWQCYDGLAAQQLWMTGDDHIAVEGDNQCADVKDGKGPLQSWQCDGANANQIFEF